MIITDYKVALVSLKYKFVLLACTMTVFSKYANHAQFLVVILALLTERVISIVNRLAKRVLRIQLVVLLAFKTMYKYFKEVVVQL